MNPSVSPSFSLSFIFVLFLLPLIECDDLVVKTCRKTPHYNLCVSSLQSNPQSYAADIKGLALIMANITLSNATDTLNFIQELINQTTDMKLERALTYYAESYIPVVKYILPQAMDALTAGRYGFANYGISDAGKEVNACEKKFSGSLKSPVSDRSQFVQSLSEVTAAIVNVLQEG